MALFIPSAGAMNHALAETVLSVLSSPEPQRAASGLRRFGERDWQRTMFWLDASGLALYFLHALRECLAEDVLPVSVVSRLRQNSADNASRTQAMLAEFKLVNRALSAAGIRFAALKGFTLVPEYCADPALRLQVDLDYLVAADQMGAVTTAVRPLAYECVSALPFERKFVTRPGTLRRHEDLYKPPVSKTLEFHFRLFDRPEFDLVTPDDALERARWAMCIGTPVHVLDDQDLFLHEALHAFQDVFLFSIRLSLLLEIATTVRTRREQHDFWDGLRERTKTWDPRVGAMIGLVLALAREMFACDIPPALRTWTVDRCSPVIRAWVREYGRKWAMQAFPGNKLSLLVTRELMDHKSWRAYARASILPVRRPPRVATASGANGSREQAQRMQRGYVARRALFHLREAVRVGMAWPGWMLRRRWLPTD